MVCPSCAEPVSAADLYCEACGHSLPKARTPAPASPSGDLPDPTPPPGAANGAWVMERDRVEVSLPTLAGVSDRGLRRERNEDAMALASLDGAGARIAVVCDGVSSSTEAATASESAARAAHAHLVKAVRAGRPDLADSMRQAVAAAHQAVRDISDGAAASDDAPASTLVAAVLRGRNVTIGWIGDSRAYFLDTTEGWQLTKDDTWAGDQVRLGLMSEAEAAADPRAHALTGWLGGEQVEAPEPSVTNFELETPGCLLLCTDGLWNYAPRVERLRELVLKAYAPDPLEMARELTDFARAAGGEDNITVVVGFV